MKTLALTALLAASASLAQAQVPEVGTVVWYTPVEVEASQDPVEVLERALALCTELGENAAARELAGALGRLRVNEVQALDVPMPDGDGTALDTSERDNRVTILRQAQEVLRKAGWGTAEGHVTELLEVSDLFDQDANPGRIQEAMADLEPLDAYWPKLVRSLNVAAELAMDMGRTQAAVNCGALAEFYSRREGVAERPDLSDRAARIPLIREALQVFVEVGDREAARFMEAMYKVGQLQLEDAPPPAFDGLLEGLSMERYYELLEQAAQLAAQRGQAERAEALQDLRAYYLQRDREQAPVTGYVAEEPTPDATEQRQAVQEARDAVDARLQELQRQIETVQREIQALEAQLQALSDQR